MKYLVLALCMLRSPFAFADELPNYDATHCEFYVNSFGVADLSYQGIEERALDVDLMVDETLLSTDPYVQIVRAGAGLDLRIITSELDAQGHPVLSVEERRRIVTAQHQIGPTHRVYFTFERRSPPQATFEEVVDVAFFVDVLRADGETVRLWQRHQGAGYTLPRVFGDLPGELRSIGNGVLHTPEATSLVYDFKRQCAR